MSEYDNGAFAFRLRQELSEKFSISESVEHGWASFGVFQLVGHGKQTNQYCGKFFKKMGCPNVDLHDKTTLDGNNFKGKIYWEPIQHWCCKPSCTICFKHGWAVRAAGKIEFRLKEASKRFGLAEHLSVNVPFSLYGSSLEVLRERVKKACFARGIVGGSLIFHGFRYANVDEARLKGVPFGWRWSVHFHVLGFLSGGYEMCRRCKHNPELLNFWDDVCRGCNGYEARTRKMWEKDSIVVKVAAEEGKVAEKRETIGGSAWYILNHSTVDISKKRFHPYTWFGVCSYRKLQISPDDYRKWVEMKKKRICPICRYDLVHMEYCGKRSFGDVASHRFKKGFVADFLEDGFPAWFVKEEKERG